MKRRPSRKLRWPAILLMLVMILPMLVLPSFAWSGTPLCNKVNVFVGDTQIIQAGESIQVDSGAYIHASVLCGDMVYLSIDQLIVSGITFSIDKENSVIGVDGVDFDARLLMLPTRQDTSDVSLGANFLANAANLNAGGHYFARVGNWIEYSGDTFPSSFMTDEAIYIPIEPMLQQAGVNTYYDTNTLTLYIGSTSPVRRAGLSNFEVVNNYYSGRFTDVASSAWYNQKVGTAYEYGLMTGSSASTFNPNGNISVAEAITTACQLHSTYYSDNYQFQATTPWYQTYVNYALSNGIITTGYSNYTVPITRAEFAVILANAFPREALTAINNVETGAIPDVPAGSNYYNAVYSLYRAGIISGSDSKGTFYPNSNITRAEAATILSNMVNTSLRNRFTLAAPTVETGIGGLEALRAIHNQYGRVLSSISERIVNKANLQSSVVCQNIYDQLNSLIQRISSDQAYNQNDPYIVRYKNSVIDMRDGMKLFIDHHSPAELTDGMRQGLTQVMHGMEEQVSLIELIQDYLNGKLSDLRGY